MNVQTLFFGELEVEDKDIVTFSQGIPGLEDLTQYTIIQPDPSIPFQYFQSLEHEQITFLVTNPFLFFEDYDIELPEFVQEELHIEHPEDVAVWTIVTVNADYTRASVNLLAPIIINNSNRTAKQIILHDSEYKVKHDLALGDFTETDHAEG
jgi:flagellar assembly factor FliW